MILRTKDVQEAASTILLAVDKTAADLEIATHDEALYLSVTNREYYVSVKLPIEAAEQFRAVVDASLFLNLVSEISEETFELNVSGSLVELKSGKSKYKLAMVYENDNLMELPKIEINNVTVSMPISKDILSSILLVNGKEIQKGKSYDKITELQKLYFVDETGCFTFTNSACMNSFTLEKPIKLLLNDRVVKLFKLFKSNAMLAFGYDQDEHSQVRAKVAIKTDNVYLAAYINCDDILLRKIQGPYDATKRFVTEHLPNSLVVSANDLSSAINRLTLFRKNGISKANMAMIPVTVKATADTLQITDTVGNVESITIENESIVDGEYEMGLNLADLKMIVDGYKDEHITLNCGNHRSVVITKENVSHVIPEGSLR